MLNACITGELFDAVDKFEEYYRLSEDKKDWRTESGKVYHTDACDHLTRIYTKISDSLDAEQKVARVEYLLKAYNSAKEGAFHSFRVTIIVEGFQACGNSLNSNEPWLLTLLVIAL